MSAYKDKERGSWYCKFYYETWDGCKRQTTKRGFATKKAAVEWENEFKASVKAEMTMTMASFVNVYFKDKKGELKERSLKNKRYMIDVHILPYFGERKVKDITASDIIQWQNTIREKGFEPTYERMIQNQMTALFTHAYNIYGLSVNPCKKVKKMGKSDANKLEFWTKDEYDKFIATIKEDDRYYTLFEILFWTGCRIGELLALTVNDVDFVNNQIHINKTYYRMNREDVVTTPKTEQSIRTIDIPEFLKNEIQEYVERLYKPQGNDRLFPVVGEAVQQKMRRHIAKSEVKKIRVHDLRHSHVAYLIHQGVQPLIIKERLGHRDIKITLNTYGHLYPSAQKAVAELLNQNK